MFAVILLLPVLGAGAHHVLYEISDEQYYEMPPLFHLDQYHQCLSRRGTFCLGSFELDADSSHQLFQNMKSYSNNWVDNFNHTKLHRGLCVSERCPAPPDPPQTLETRATWFASCVNATTMSTYNLSAQLYDLKYCQSGPEEQPPLSASERGFAGLLAAVLALAAVSTVLDLTLPDHAKKGASWSVAWSVRGCWGALQAPPAPLAAASGADLRAFDGLRVLCMLCVIIEHVAWITTQTYLSDTRRYELTRRAADAMAMANSTLMVQVFFLMASFLLAHKLLQQRARRQEEGAVYTFFKTMLNRIIRISPCYFVVVWFAASWWERLDSGPLWSPLVREEAAVCRTKWWTQLLYLNNVLYADDKCLIQTWYLAADMQLYAMSLALTLALRRFRRGALIALTALLAAVIAAVATLAYTWHLVPNYVMHRPESVRVRYVDEATFNVVYQSPLGNAPGALLGLLLAHTHHALQASHVQLSDYRLFRWASVLAVPLAVWWVVSSPLLVSRAAGPRAAAAALAALERPVFASLVSLALLGAMNGIPSSVGRVLSWRGWRVWARLSFGALLLHMFINKSLVAARLTPSQLDRQSAILEWFGVTSVSYLAALPLALLVELPFQRLHRALQELKTPAPGGNPPQKADLRTT